MKTRETLAPSAARFAADAACETNKRACWKRRKSEYAGGWRSAWIGVLGRIQSGEALLERV